MKIGVPEDSLIVLVGPSGSGKSTFAARHFIPTEVISSDRCRGLISDNEADWSINQDAFDIVFCIARKRLARRKLTVIDATSVRPRDREPLLAIAREFDVPAVAIVFDLPPETCHARNQARPDRNFGRQTVERHSALLRESLADMQEEGFLQVHVLSSETAVNEVVIERHPDRKGHGATRSPDKPQ